MKLKPFAIVAIAAAGLIPGLTGCSIPDYDPVTVVYQDYAENMTITWIVRGSEITRSEQIDDDAATETTDEIPDRAAFVNSVHEELHPPKWDGCTEANEMTIETEDPAGKSYASTLEDCGIQESFVDDMFWALGEER